MSHFQKQGGGGWGWSCWELGAKESTILGLEVGLNQTLRHQGLKG